MVFGPEPQWLVAKTIVIYIERGIFEWHKSKMKKDIRGILLNIQKSSDFFTENSMVKKAKYVAVYLVSRILKMCFLNVKTAV